MSKRSRPSSGSEDDPGRSPTTGPNLILLYSLIALALAAAIALALLIVFPYYRHR